VTAPNPGGSVGPEAAYYQEVEEFFVSRRGDPLFLSNADWLLVRKWRRAGIPLRIVLRGIADALDGHAHSWGRDRKVGSLQYCAAEVEAARDRWARAVGEGADDTDADARLEQMMSALANARALGPASAVAAARAREAIAGLRGSRPAEVEARLKRLEEELLDAVRREADRGALAQAESEVDAELAPYRGRMPARVAAQIRADALARRLLGGHGLPRLTLFF
jgi:hypothetical protein